MDPHGANTTSTVQPRRPTIVLQSALDGMVWGAMVGAAYGMLVLLSLFFSTGAPNEPFALDTAITEAAYTVVWLALAAMIGSVVGTVLGLASGVAVGLALSPRRRPDAASRILAAVAAALPPALLALTLHPGDGSHFWTTVLFVLPALAAATLAAVRAPAILRRATAASTPWGTPDAGAASVRHLPA
jgi:hypothetical protein